MAENEGNCCESTLMSIIKYIFIAFFLGLVIGAIMLWKLTSKKKLNY